VRLTSIRARFIILAVIFSALLVGAVTVSTYFFVSGGMRVAAEDTSSRLSRVAGDLVAQITTRARQHADKMGLEGDEAERFVSQTALETVSGVFGEGLAYDSFYTMYVREKPGDAVTGVWTSYDGPIPAPDPGCIEALETGVIGTDYPDGPISLAGLFVPAELGQYVSHVPIEIPGIDAAVIDVHYLPRHEEAALDAARGPMLIVAMVAVVLSIASMSMLMSWALSLVARIKSTAEAIDAGRLDVHLPEQGENEITDLARSLNRLIDNLRRRNEVQARFIADASHELATPVAGIRGYVNILRAWGADDPALREEAVRAIDRESSRMARLCGDLLSGIRSDETLEYRSVKFDLNGVCREVLAAAATRYVGKGLEITGPEEAAIEMQCDPDRVEEVLGVLVDNACKYTPEGGSVSLRTAVVRDAALITIADTGIGIPEKDLPNVFERFYRSDASRSKETGGFGLGLAIAKQIVEACGGSISVASAPDSGTTFEVRLPLTWHGA